MRKWFWTLLVACLALASACNSTEIKKASEQPTKRYLVALNDDAAHVAFMASETVYSADANINNIATIDVTVLNLTEAQANELRKRPGVKGVFENREVFLHKPMAKMVHEMPPHDGEVVPWGVRRLLGPENADDGELPELFKRGIMGKGKKVCVVDTGVDGTHPDFIRKDGTSVVIAGKDFTATKGNEDGKDDQGHGSHVAGTIAAPINGVGVIGMAPEADIISAKVLNKNGSGSFESVAAGIAYCIEEEANVINMSLGAPVGAEVLQYLLALARYNNISTAAAAGNSDDLVGYPAAYPEAIAVAAGGTYSEDGNTTKETDVRASFSCYGPQVLVTAPGVDICSVKLGGGHACWAGTSMAAPHVAGAIALMLSADDTLRPNEIADLLKRSAWSISEDGNFSPYTGYGIPMVESIVLKLGRPEQE